MTELAGARGSEVVTDTGVEHIGVSAILRPQLWKAKRRDIQVITAEMVDTEVHIEIFCDVKCP